MRRNSTQLKILFILYMLEALCDHSQRVWCVVMHSNAIFSLALQCKQYRNECGSSEKCAERRRGVENFCEILLLAFMYILVADNIAHRNGAEPFYFSSSSRKICLSGHCVLLLCVYVLKGKFHRFSLEIYKRISSLLICSI